MGIVRGSLPHASAASGIIPPMQLAPITSVAPVQPLAAPLAPQASALIAPARAATTGPIVDMPGIAAGDEFDLVDGTKVGPIGIKGEGWLDTFDPDHIALRVKGGRFGFKVDVAVDITRVDAERVRIATKGSGMVGDSDLIARIVESRPGYALFELEADPSKKTLITWDGSRRMVIDTDAVPNVGHAHLVLDRR